ncbi:MAG: winged helix-turn-helix domain-containing protein [Henriciella sp.]
MTTYSFDEFSFNCDTLTLQKNGVDILLRHQPAKLLKHLLEAAPGIVSRQTLQTEIWDDGVNVEFEQSLNACVNQLRSVLGDQARNARFIETLPKRGYRFIADIEPVIEAEPRRVHPGWMAFAALALAAVLLLALVYPRAPDTDPVSIYVSPVAVDFPTSSEDEDAIQYALRVGIVEQLIRYDPESFLVINGESLWEDISQGADDDRNYHDYLLLLNLRRSDQSYSVDAVLSAPTRAVELARTSIALEHLSPDAYAETAEAVSEWAATTIHSGASPVARPDPVLEYNTAYYRNILNGQRALRFANFTSLVESIDWFDKALVISPQSPDALAGKAIALSMLVDSRGYPRDETFAEIIDIADAIERNSGIHPRAQLVRGVVYLHRDWDIEKAKAAFMRASQLAPGDALIHSWKATLMAVEGDVAGALQVSSVAVSMDPMAQASNSDRCWHLNAADRFSESVQYCDWALEIDPHNAFNRLSLVLALQKSEQPQRATEVLQPLIEYVGQNYDGGAPEFVKDNPRENLRDMYCHLADVLEPRTQKGGASVYLVASFWAMCGNYEVVPALLQTATDNREIGILYYKLDAHFDEYRASLIGRRADNSRFPGADSRMP